MNQLYFPLQNNLLTKARICSSQNGFGSERPVRVKSFWNCDDLNKRQQRPWFWVQRNGQDVRGGLGTPSGVQRHRQVSILLWIICKKQTSPENYTLNEA